MVITCAVLQAFAVGLARWAYLGFGWRMYSKIACDATLPDAERRRAIGLRLGRFSAVAKLDIQLLCLLLIVGVVNGVNPSGTSPLVSLIVVAVVGVVAAAAWLAACWTAVMSARPKLGLATEFTYPLCYIVAAALMFSSVSYGSRIAQLHGQVYLFVYPMLFVASHTWVWWDARLLSVSDIPRHQRDFAARQRRQRENTTTTTNNNNNTKKKNVDGMVMMIDPGSSDSDDCDGNGLGGNVGGSTHHTDNKFNNAHVPPEILPLVHGAWLLKLPSVDKLTSYSSSSNYSNPNHRSWALRDLLFAARGASRGRWRYFQLSHDGSTLRWDWRKFVLLVHVESVSCCTEDLTITLSLTLEPDLRLKFPDAELHAAWARGLTLLVMLLGNPDGLVGRRHLPPPLPSSSALPRHDSTNRMSPIGANGGGGGGGSTGKGSALPNGNMPSYGGGGGVSGGGIIGGGMMGSIPKGGNDTATSTDLDNSPNRLLYRLASASGRASAAGLLSKEELEYAAWQARKALNDCSQPPSPVAPHEEGHGSEYDGDDAKEVMGKDDGVGQYHRHTNPVFVNPAVGENNNNSQRGQYHQVISLTATAVTPRSRSHSRNAGGGDGSVLRQRTPTRRNSSSGGGSGSGSGMQTTTSTTTPAYAQSQYSPSPSKTKRRRGGAGGGGGGAETQSWLRRTLTAPVSTLAAGFQQAAANAAIRLQTTTTTTNPPTQLVNSAEMVPRSPFDVEAQNSTPPPGAGHYMGEGKYVNAAKAAATTMPAGRRLFASPPRTVLPLPPQFHNRRHLRSSSLDGGQLMPPVPEGSGSFTPAPPLPPSLPLPPPASTLTNPATPPVVFHLVAQTQSAGGSGGSGHGGGSGGRYVARASSNSPASGGKPTIGIAANSTLSMLQNTKPRPGSPLKNSSGPVMSGGATAMMGMAINPALAPVLATTAAIAAQHQQQQKQQQQQQAYAVMQPPSSLLRYASAPMFTLQHALSGVDSSNTNVIQPAESEEVSTATTNTTTLSAQNSLGLPPLQPPPATTNALLVHQSSSLSRYDSLGPQMAPGSKLWQAMFDAGMASYHQYNSATTAHAQAANSGMSGSVDGSPSPIATPLSVARSMVAVNMELIDFDQLSFGRMLGEGAEGPVYAAWFQETPVAVKRASSQSEVDLHLHAGWHDNIVNLRGLAQHGGHTYLVMELCPRGTLDVLIHQGSSASPLKMDPTKLLPIVRSIARGMLHLHTRSPPVLHRDLKPANIFIGHGYVMKIGDFGMARYGADTRPQRLAQAHLDPGRYGTGAAPLLRTLTPGVIGTAAYCAPELLHPATPKAGGMVEEFHEERLLKADVYSFGVLLWELLERRRPYAGMEGFQIQTQWVLDPGAMKLRPPRMPENCKTPAARRAVQVMIDLVEACTAWDPNARPSFKDILAMLRGAGQEGDQPPPPVTHLTSPF